MLDLMRHPLGERARPPRERCRDHGAYSNRAAHFAVSDGLFIVFILSR
jgi:hypothetical protein